MKRLAILFGLAALAGCARPQSSAETSGDARALAACRARADSVYEQQNRGAVFTATDSRDSPKSGNYVSGVTTRGLGDRFGRDQMIDDCLRVSGAASGAASAGVDRSGGSTFTPVAQ